jgi:membrane protein YdbS with pleckstrin-like domain
MAAPSDVPEPAQRLDPAARWAWRAAWLLATLAAVVVGGVAGISSALVALVGIALFAGAVIVPELRYRRWRWDVREHEIDIQRGVLVERRTLIPMERVQHVETERSIIGQALELATVKIHTAAGSHEIPLLAEYDAGRLRARIAELARTTDG